MHLQGRHVLISGGAQGIGLEVCKLLIQRDVASIAILDVLETALTAAEQLLNSLSRNDESRCRTYVVDVTDFDQV